MRMCKDQSQLTDGNFRGLSRCEAFRGGSHYLPLISKPGLLQWPSIQVLTRANLAQPRDLLRQAWHMVTRSSAKTKQNKGVHTRKVSSHLTEAEDLVMCIKCHQHSVLFYEMHMIARMRLGAPPSVQCRWLSKPKARDWSHRSGSLIQYLELFVLLSLCGMKGSLLLGKKSSPAFHSHRLSKERLDADYLLPRKLPQHLLHIW